MDFGNFLGLAATALSILAVLIGGALWVLQLVTRLSNRMITLERDCESIKTELDTLEIKTNKDREENSQFRHKHESSVKSLYVLIETKFSDSSKHWEDFKELITTKIDLAISKNNEKR